MLHILPLAVLALTTSTPVANSDVQPVGNPDSIQITDRRATPGPVCFKMRTYIFERNDGAAPKLVRETTCSPGMPSMQRAKPLTPRFVPGK